MSENNGNWEDVLVAAVLWGDADLICSLLSGKNASGVRVVEKDGHLKPELLPNNS